MKQTTRKVASTIVGKKIANKMGTAVVGRFAGRLVPYVGWGLFANDLYENREAIIRLSELSQETRQKALDLYGPTFGPGIFCFEKGTLIYGSNGLVPIENINVGDSVYSYNLQTNTTELNKVANTFRRETKAIYELKFNSETVYVTAEHPFYVIGKGWVKVKDLKTGDELQSSVKEKSVKITSIILQDRKVMVYNIEVDKNHNYFVSNDKILVHNKSVGESNNIDIIQNKHNKKWILKFLKKLNFLQ